MLKTPVCFSYKHLTFVRKVNVYSLGLTLRSIALAVDTGCPLVQLGHDVNT